MMNVVMVNTIKLIGMAPNRIVLLSFK
jgi:hypothetical protein